MKEPNVSIGLVGVIIAVLFWGSAFPCVRYAVQKFDPVNLVALRFFIASSVLLMFALLSKQIRRPETKDIPLLIAQGILGISAYHFLLSWGQLTVPAGTASLLNASSPCMAALLAATFLGESLSRRGWLGMLIGFSGVSLIIIGQGKDVSLTFSSILILLAALSQSFYYILQRPFFGKYSPLELGCYTLWGGTLPMLLFLKTPPSLEVGLTIAYLGIFPAAFAYIAWTYALASFSTARASSFLYLVPVVAIIVSWLWLNEKPTLLSFVGGGIVMAGVVFVNDAKLSPSQKS
jgi:drug/metabolite transporter (DMT)-like permease